MSDRAKKRKPVTAEELESFLDYMAGLMGRNPRQAELALPIWRTLELRRTERIQADAHLAAAAERFRRLSDRTAERSL